MERQEAGLRNLFSKIFFNISIQKMRVIEHEHRQIILSSQYAVI